MSSAAGCDGHDPSLVVRGFHRSGARVEALLECLLRLYAAIGGRRRFLLRPFLQQGKKGIALALERVGISRLHRGLVTGRLMSFARSRAYSLESSPRIGSVGGK